jgi:hypothetical protein
LPNCGDFPYSRTIGQEKQSNLPHEKYFYCKNPQRRDNTFIVYAERGQVSFLTRSIMADFSVLIPVDPALENYMRGLTGCTDCPVLAARKKSS